MRAILAVMKKELKSIFRNKTILAQIILIPFLYIFGFTMLMTTMAPSTEIEPDKLKGYYINIDGEIASELEQLGLRQSSLEKLDNVKTEIKNSEIDVVVVFPDEFLTAPTEIIQNVDIWFDSSDESSYKAFVAITTMIDSLNPTLFTINSNSEIKYDLVDEAKSVKEMLALVFPAYIFMSVFLASQALAAESIAGDKERGFLNMMLLAPVPRYTIALGKSLALLTVNLISTISAFAAVAISLPKLSEAMGVTTVVAYTTTDYIHFCLLTVSATTLLLGLVLLISTIANSVKQASSIGSVVMIIVMIISMLMSTENDVVKDILTAGVANAYIPVWNSIIGLQCVFKQTLQPNMTPITCIINFVSVAIILGIIAKLFESETIVNNTST